ncbi:MAG: hypothetical protein ACEQSC_00050 [Candidatus Nanopelagicaceae bacterium]
MPKQKPNTETVDFRFTLTDEPGSPKILAAKWLRTRRTEALDFIARGMKPEITAQNGATPHQIHVAKIESAAFHRYMAEALGAQIALERGELPVIADAPPVSQVPIIATTPSPQASSLVAPSVDDDDDDDDYEVPPPNPDDEPDYEIDL